MSSFTLGSGAVHVQIGRRGRVLQCLVDVSVLEIGVLLEGLIERPAGGDQADHGSTAMRSPRIHGLPSSLSGSTVMRSNASATSPRVAPRLAEACRACA